MGRLMAMLYVLSAPSVYSAPCSFPFMDQMTGVLGAATIVRDLFSPALRLSAAALSSRVKKQPSPFLHCAATLQVPSPALPPFLLGSSKGRDRRGREVEEGAKQ